MASVGSSITRQENPIVQDDKNDSEVKYLCSVGRQRNLKPEEEVYFYLLDRFGVMLANWLQDAFVGLFKCTDPEDHRDQDIAVWACPIDASQLKDRTQEPELEKLTVDYTQGYMGDAFADFLSLIFCGHIQEGLVDSRSGMNMMMILTKPLCLLIEKIEKNENTLAVFAVVPFIKDHLSRPEVIWPKGAPNKQGLSWQKTCSHRQCADCDLLLTTNTCLDCKLLLCKMCCKVCNICNKRLCPFCTSTRPHVCLPQKLLFHGALTSSVSTSFAAWAPSVEC